MGDRYSRRQPYQLAMPGCGADSLGEAIAEYLRSLRVENYSEGTLENRCIHLTHLARWLACRGVQRPQEVTRALLDEYQALLHAEVLPGGARRAAGTQGQRLTAVREFFGYLFRAERLPVNPARFLRLPRTDRPLPKPVLTAEEVELVMAQPDVTTAWGLRDRAMLETLFATGIRRQELAWLRLDDIEWERGELRIRRGKGGRGRVVPISVRALHWIGRYLTVRPAPANPDDADVLFLTGRGRMCGLVHLSRSVTAYAEAANLGKRVGCHTFRATTATMMLEAGADIRFVQEMLGHAKITTTQHYTRVSIGALHQVYNRTHPSAM